MSYGIPYMGSKNAIAEWIIDLLPSNEWFVDLFAGGCAVTHRAMLSGKFSKFIVNDIGDAPSLFIDAIKGKYHDENRWISRDDFFRLKDTDPYIRYCWSFGNSQSNYLYGIKIEPYKRALHYAIVNDEWNELKILCPEIYDYAYNSLAGITGIDKRRLALCKAIVTRLKGIGDWELVQGNPLYKSCGWRGGKLKRDGTVSNQKSKGGQDLKIQHFNQLNRLQQLENLNRSRDLPSLERLKRLPSLERLKRLPSLERLKRLQSLESLKLSYEQVQIPENSTVYCDIPYKGTHDYGVSFDYAKFYEWCRKMDFPVFISEYQMPDDFVEIAYHGKICKFSGTKNNKVTEKIFVHEKFKDAINKYVKICLF